MKRYTFNKHFLRSGSADTIMDQEWRWATEADFVAAERAAGFHPKPDLPQDKPATAGFSTSSGDWTDEGRIESRTIYKVG